MKRENAKSREILASLENSMSFKRIETRMLVAKMLYDFLKAQAISQQALASMMGKQPSEVSKWLSGNHNFTIDTLSDIGFVLKKDFLVKSEYTNHHCKPTMRISFPEKRRDIFEMSSILTNKIEGTDYEPSYIMEKCLA